MKKTLTALCLFGLVAGFGYQAHAGSGCCPTKKAAKPSVEELTTALDLTPEQQEKLTALRAECEATKCDKSAKQKYCDGMTELLSPEQKAKCEKVCAEKGWKCPAPKAETPEEAAEPSDS